LTIQDSTHHHYCDRSRSIHLKADLQAGSKRKADMVLLLFGAELPA
jgi:hypothetical protein